MSDDVKKVLLIAIIVISAVYLIMTLFFPKQSHNNHKLPEEISVEEEIPQKEEEVLPINIFFIATNEKGEEVYRAVKRNYNSSDGELINFAVQQLLLGPTNYEKSKGIYSEIPQNTFLIGIEEFSDRYVINLSKDFETGGGSDSLYKRLYQLIKTVNKNSDLPVYLNINGKQVNVIGGEGLSIKQPLNGASLSE